MSISAKKISELLVNKLSAATSKEEQESLISAFATLITKGNKVSKLGHIIKVFSKKWNTTHNEMDVVLSTTSGEEIDFPKTLQGKKVNLKMKKVPHLIGGITIETEGLCIDNSLITKLRSLKSHY
jgi:F0F1-type ATP synthase delta subunit